MARARQAKEVMATPVGARATVKAAIDALGGVYVVAPMIGMHFTGLYAFLRGGGLTDENAGKLRALLVDVPADVWADVFAPLPVTAEASTEATETAAP